MTTRSRHRVLAIVTLLMTCAILPGCASPHSQALGLMEDIQREDEWFAQGSSSLAAIRLTVEQLPEVKGLLRLGRPAALLAMKRFETPSVPNADHALACYAYIIEWNRLTEATPVLENFLRSHPGRRHFVWSPHFVVRALLVLKGIPDPTGGYDAYSASDYRRAMGLPPKVR